jgi:NAD(P)-dependent dehydrogenase (short-subunit alcohol dehydrogenase family)
MPPCPSCPIAHQVCDQLGQQITFPKRLGNPEDFAKLVEHIINNGYINGEVIRLDGAFRLP